MVMKYTIEKTIRQIVYETEKAKTFLNSVAKRYVKFDKVKKGHYLPLVENIRYDGVSGVCEHIMKLMNYYNKLKSMKVNLDDSFLV